MILSIRSRQGRDGLGRTEDQAAVRAQGERERLEGDPLQRRREVDQDVAAEEQVDPRERHAGAQVVLAEDHLGAQSLDDLVARRRPA